MPNQPLFYPPPPLDDPSPTEHFAATLDAALATQPVEPDHPFKVEDLHDVDILIHPPPHHLTPLRTRPAPTPPQTTPSTNPSWLPDLVDPHPLPPPPPPHHHHQHHHHHHHLPHHPPLHHPHPPAAHPSPHPPLPLHAPPPPPPPPPPLPSATSTTLTTTASTVTTTANPSSLALGASPSVVAPPLTVLSNLTPLVADFQKPINALGPMCFAGFYLVSLTRTIVRNRTVPHQVRAAFMAPQLQFGFTVRDARDPKWRHVPTVQIPYDSLSAAGCWLRGRLGIAEDNCTFKMVKDALQKAVTEAWAEGRWYELVVTLGVGGGGVSPAEVEEALACEAVSGRAMGTPVEYFRKINCHKGAPDIRRDVDGAISAREALRWVLAELGLDSRGCGIPVATFRDEVFPLWRMHCEYVRLHQVEGCCQFYEGGYFKKIMVHRHLYNVDGCSSSYHVKDLFEGLDEVIKVWSNPTGMCVREAKCAAGLRYNVDKSFQSGIRSYSKAKFLEAAPHAARELLERERQLHASVQATLVMKQKRHPKCRQALRNIEMRNAVLSQRQLPDELRSGMFEGAGGRMMTTVVCGQARKRKRQDRDGVVTSPSTPREQKRKHAHLSLKRKEAAEKRVKEYLELLRGDCQRQQNFLETVLAHGVDCSCRETNHGDANVPSYPTSANVPVA